MDQGAVEDLLKYPRETWSRASFETYYKNQSVDNNHTESFNSWILDARYRPIIGMLEEIRLKVMEMMRDHEAEVKSWVCDYSPSSVKLYNEHVKISKKCICYYNGDDGYEVIEGTDKHTVSLKLKMCSCREWDLSGIPCAHAISAMARKKIDPLSQIHWYYTKEAYLLTYKHKLQPVRGEKFWKVDPSRAMLPPKMTGNMVGRPKVVRTRQKDEAIKRQGTWKSKRKGRVGSCSTRGETGHNARTCDKQIAKKNKVGKGKRHLGADKGKMPMKKPRSVGVHESQANQYVFPQRLTQESQAHSFVFPHSMTQESQAHSFVLPQSMTQESQQSFSSFQASSGFPLEDEPVRPRMVSEIDTRLCERQERQLQQVGPRKIKFVGDDSGTSEPRGLMWKGNSAITSAQLGRHVLEKNKDGKG